LPLTTDCRLLPCINTTSHAQTPRRCNPPPRLTIVSTHLRRRREGSWQDTRLSSSSHGIPGLSGHERHRAFSVPATAAASGEQCQRVSWLVIESYSSRRCIDLGSFVNGLLAVSDTETELLQHPSRPRGTASCVDRWMAGLKEALP